MAINNMRSGEVASVNRVKINICLLLMLLLALMAVTCGCSASKSSDTNTTSKGGSSTKSQTAAGSNPSPTPTSKQTTAPAKPKPAPTLSQVTFSLSLQPPQEYNEYTQPIYLKSENILHLVWTVTGAGDHLYLTFNTPNGQYIGVKADGNMVDLSPNRASEKLPRVGSLILKPSSLGFGEGYYIFRTYITGKDQAINVKLIYWIEE